MQHTSDLPPIISQAVSYIQSKSSSFSPKVGIILGSGLLEATPDLKIEHSLDFKEIPGAVQTAVSGHKGRLLLGKAGPVNVAVAQGRLHYYEGHEMQDVSLLVRVLCRLGLETLIVTSAVGSMNLRFKPGHFVLLKDHLNFLGVNPLRGKYDESYGQMFPDMSEPYDSKLRKTARGISKKLNIPMAEGVYVAVSGPTYETPAEIKAYRRLGGDIIGMSMVPEVLVARQMGVRVMGLSWVANFGSGLSKTPIRHGDVLKLGEKVSRQMKGFLEAMLKGS